ncbi:F-box domain-containing protein [Favolaschia claudopus]|uniref:F-box domain-containing protein n=1 Tax=Favolaschia claudopus TaxID=2862362 RepID=A0AAV9ZT47_9AGAR
MTIAQPLPLDLPARTILANFVDDRARLVELESQIKVLQQALATLRLEESTIQERLDAYRYPVLTLPNEIVAEIFVHFLPRYPICPPPAGPDSPVLLTHICRLWREIACSTPQLWRAISLSSVEYRSLNPDYIWLNIAGCCPLSIHMNETHEYAISEGEFLTAFLPIRARCEYLQLQVEYHASALPTIEGKFPLLRHLDIELDHDAPREIQFLDAPMLRSVVFDGWAASWVTRLPWAQLTTLSLHQIAFESCVPILQTATNLLDCRLDMIISEADFAFHAPSIVLPCLRSLKVDADNSMDGFLHSFILPALSSLTVCGELLGQDAVLSLRSFVARSGCHLQHLHITCITTTILVEESYRLAFPSIRKMTFSVDPDPQPLHLLSNWDL